ncbi:MAG: hypothetical protein AB8B72_04055 [Crocinitomicaceae bacterium]
MKILFVLTILLISSFTYGQVNDSPLSAYTWKGKKTELSPGYVVLKSGKKMMGEISLTGKSGNVSGIYFEGDGKEIDFPLTAIQSYGLKGADSETGNSSYYSGRIVCDVNADMFTWRDMGVQMGKQINNTKPRSGYVIKRDGSRVDGELQIKMVDKVMTEFVVKSGKNKFKIPSSDVGHYGLKMLMSELTKNGEKNYKDEAKNFHRGVVQLANGQTLEGMIAFKDKSPINPNRPGAGDKYNGMYYAKDAKSFVESYSDNELVSVTQYVNGQEELYSPYEGGFVSSTTMDNARYSDKSKAFNQGTVTLLNGETKTGEVAKPNSQKINFRSAQGIISAYEPNQVEKVEVKVEGEPMVFINVDGFFMEEIVNGNTFWVYKNPNPTTVNQRKTNLANSIQSAAASGASAVASNQTEKDLGVDVNLDSVVRSKTTEELTQARLAIAKSNGYNTIEERDAGSIPEGPTAKLDLAMRFELLARSNENDVVIYYEEYIMINKSTNNQTILYKDKDVMTERLEGILMGCYTFLELDKKEQKEFYDIDNLKRTFKILEECY